ncbi:NlpC/P60 family protein [Alcanivorax sediminis]|nr:NlpC/P60 family protein [Alcanivorax sediminis]
MAKVPGNGLLAQYTGRRFLGTFPCDCCQTRQVSNHTLSMPFKPVSHSTSLATMLFCIALSACATKNIPPVQDASPANEPQPPKDDNTTAELLTSDNFLLNSLLAQKEDWQGVPYRYGGLSTKGVDCSGFVYLTFLSQLNMHVPRTTAELLKEGEPVARNELTVGDLVFFRLSRGNRHVGIYLGDDSFLHASVSNGVMQSSLGNPYWRERYWQARRLVGR